MRLAHSTPELNSDSLAELATWPRGFTVDRAGENMITVSPGANHEVSAGDLTVWPGANHEVSAGDPAETASASRDVLVISAEVPAARSASFRLRG